MKVLLDTCVWGGVKAELQASGHDVIWAGDWEHDPGDEEILSIAHQDQRVVNYLRQRFWRTCRCIWITPLRNYPPGESFSETAGKDLLAYPGKLRRRSQRKCNHHRRYRTGTHPTWR